MTLIGIICLVIQRTETEPLLCNTNRYHHSIIRDNYKSIIPCQTTRFSMQHIYGLSTDPRPCHCLGTLPYGIRQELLPWYPFLDITTRLVEDPIGRSISMKTYHDGIQVR